MKTNEEIENFQDEKTEEMKKTENFIEKLQSELKIEIENLKKQLKMKRKMKTQKAVMHLMILTITFIVSSEYFGNVWYIALLKSLGFIFIIGFLILTYKFIKYVKAKP